MSEPATEHRLPALDRYTCVTPIRLVTPATLCQALSLVGVTWNPSPDENQWHSNGLYAWVAGSHGDPLEAGCIYVGMAKQFNGEGLRKRLSDEKGWSTSEYAHGHGMAAYRLDALVVAGEPKYTGTDLRWLEDVDVEPEYRASVLTISSASPTLETVEALAIRLSAHLGDTVAPLNSKHASAWAYKTDVDRAAWTIAYYLTTRDC